MLVESIYNLSSKLNHKNMPLVIGITSNSDFNFSRTIDNKLDGTEREQGSRAAPQALDRSQGLWSLYQKINKCWKIETSKLIIVEPTCP